MIPKIYSDVYCTRGVHPETKTISIDTVTRVHEMEGVFHELHKHIVGRKKAKL